MLPKKRKRNLWVLLLVAFAACGDSDESPLPPVEATGDVVIRINELEAGDRLPEYMTCDDRGLSPPSISWKGPPDTEEYVLTMVDLDAPGGEFVHWTVFGMSITELSFGTLPLSPGGGEGMNDFGDPGYGAPCPPEGDGPHQYLFRVYALDKAVTARLPGGVAYERLIAKLRCCITAEGTFPTFYER
jgi:Raf kinase inhibitor-like YbhB/YbcL family protein